MLFLLCFYVSSRVFKDVKWVEATSTDWEVNKWWTQGHGLHSRIYPN